MVLRKTKPIPDGTEPTEKIAQIKRGIIATRGSQADLGRIVKAGAVRGASLDALLDLLASAVAPQEEISADEVRAKQRQLESIAGQVRTVTRHAERLANDPSYYLHFYSPFAGRDAKDYKKREAALLASRWPFAAMRSYAEWAEIQARAFGWWLRRNSQKESNLGIMFLLLQVHLWTGRLFEPELARLLTDASEAAGEKVFFSSSRLTKMFNRHVLSAHRMKRKKH
jgi:hypothetical protein